MQLGRAEMIPKTPKTLDNSPVSPTLPNRFRLLNSNSHADNKSVELEANNHSSNKSKSGNQAVADKRTPTTLAEMVYPLLTEAAHVQELEAFRIAWERRTGRETDLTRNYTSLWPLAEQNWMLDHEPRRYFDGLPEFARAFIKAKCQAAARAGRLDDLGHRFLGLFVRGEMKVEEA